MKFPGMPGKIFDFLASKTLALGLFCVLCLASLPATFAKSRELYSSAPFVVLLGLLGLNLLACTIRRFKTLSMPVVALHLGVILTLSGGAVSALGFVATVNVYEGTAVDTAYRWDRKQQEPLGMELGVRRIGMEYHPTPVKVGVLERGEKKGLFVLKTGESFSLGEYGITIDGLDVSRKTIRLSVRNKEHFIGRADTGGPRELPPDFLFDFVLVAYQDPVPKRAWIEVTLSRGGRVIAEGTSEVNSPFEWQGLSIHNTRIEEDSYGNRYAGIQITRDPGRPAVYLGFIIVCFGSVLYLFRRLSIVRQFIG